MKVYWCKSELDKNIQVCLRKRFQANKNAVISVVAKDTYQLFVNGRFVHYGPARTAEGYARVDKLQIDEFLTEDENTVSLIVTGLNTNTLSFAEGEPYCGVELNVNGDIFGADSFDWFLLTDRITKTERMSLQRGFVEVYDMKEDRKNFGDAYKKTEFYQKPTPVILERNVSYAKNESERAVLLQRGSVKREAVEPWKCGFTELLDTGEKLNAYARKDCEVLVSKEVESFRFFPNDHGELNYYLYGLPKNTCGIFQLKLRANRDSVVWLIYDELLIDGKIRFNRDPFIHAIKWSLKKGEYNLFSSEVYLAKYICLVVEGEIEPQTVSVVKIENPNINSRKAEEIKDEELKAIYLASERSFAHNAYDILTDCPSRERAGWLCDSYFLARAERFFTGDNKVEKNLLENYLLYSNHYFEDNGIVPMCYPSIPSSKDDYIPNWILWYLIELEDYRHRTKDEEFLHRHEKRIRDILSFFEKCENEDGLLEDLDGWVFVDWSKSNDFTQGVNYPSNMLYVGALLTAAELLGDKSLSIKAEKLKKTIVEQAFNGEFFIDNATRENGVLMRTNNISETCQNYAMFFEIISPKENPNYYQKMINNFHLREECEKQSLIYPANMFIGYILRLSVLFREKEYGLLLEECKMKFLSMAEQTGTLWELFSQNASCDHGFGSILGQLIFDSYQFINKSENKAK